MKRYLDYKIDNSTFNIEKFKKFVNTHYCPDLTLDLSELNIFDTVKFLVLSSAYHYSKYPEGKLKCHITSADVKIFISTFTTDNLELV